MAAFFIIIAIIVIALIVFIQLVKSDGGSTTPKPNAVSDTSYYDYYAEDNGCASPDYRTYIAGVNFRCDKNDIGGFVGYAIPENNNPKDRNAVAIYRNDGKHIGYIPKDLAKEFRNWSNSQKVPCVGYISQDDNGELMGRIKALDYKNPEYVKGETISYINWMVSKFGESYRPRES